MLWSYFSITFDLFAPPRYLILNFLKCDSSFYEALNLQKLNEIGNLLCVTRIQWDSTRFYDFIWNLSNKNSSGNSFD